MSDVKHNHEIKTDVEHNHEILFLYDARLCNPNGDPDEENRPRMDYDTRRNLVSDVRLKRYLRDFWISWTEEDWKRDPWEYPFPQDVWVRPVGGEVVTAKERIERLAAEFRKSHSKFAKRKTKELAKEPSFRQWLLERLIDVRMFGATMPIGAEEGGATGGHLTYTGPVQFSWGYSLNRVDLVPSSTITSRFAGRDEGEKGEYGTMGKDWRVKYSFLAFYGMVSAWRARETRLLEKDIELLDHSLLNGLPLMATSRSKLGQTSRLYLRVEYQDDATFLGDFRPYLCLKPYDGLESLDDVHMEFQALLELLKENKKRIAEVVIWTHPQFKDGQDFVEALKKSEELKEKVQPPQS